MTAPPTLSTPFHAMTLAELERERVYWTELAKIDRHPVNAVCRTGCNNWIAQRRREAAAQELARSA